MKINIALILSIIFAVGIVAFGFTAFQISSERIQLKSELENKAKSLADEFYDKYLQELNFGDTLSKLNVNSEVKRYNFLSVIIFFNSDSIVSLNNDEVINIAASSDNVSRVLASDSSIGDYIKLNGKDLYQYSKVVERTDLPEIAIAFFTDASYIENILNKIWFRNFVRWFLQAMVISIVTLFIVRWGILTPLNSFTNWVKAARAGDIQQLKVEPLSTFLAPLYKEISGIAKAMQEAQAIAQEEAKLRTSGESVWTAERLNEEMKLLLKDRKLVVVSNREPYMHIHVGKKIECIMPASGMVTALEPILKACGGLWVASGSGDADRETVDDNDKVLVPPYDNKYTLRRIWLSKEQEDHFYYGFSNEGLWPLCHIAHTRPIFRKTDWEYYLQVNEMYANAVLQEIAHEEEPFILVQDYHFALLPKLIKEKRPDAKVAIFWHIPWPNPESFGICPWQKEILMGMLGADLIGFHTQYHCNNFLETVNNTLESRVIWENFSVKIGTHFTLVKPFPISIAFTLKDYESKGEFKPEATEILRQYGIQGQYFGIGVDRIDYTKGLLEKFYSIERFLEKYPEFQGKFTFVQVGAPSRSLIKSYSDTTNAIETEANRINWKFKTKQWQPIVFLKKHHSHEEIMPLYKAANFCMVTSLHDGMNLVAKEYIAARDQNDGVLILSQFAGASQELHGSIIINPYDIEQSADAIYEALKMSLENQQLKMKQMRRMVMSHNVYSWAASILRSMRSIQN